MASECSQPIAHSNPHASIVELGFQFPKPPTPLRCVDVQFVYDGRAVSMNGGRFQAPPAVGQSLPPACAAELSEDGEIFDSDDDLPSVRQILALPKRVIEVVDLTCDDDGDSEGDDGNHTEVSWLRYTPSLTDRFRLAD